MTSESLEERRAQRLRRAQKAAQRVAADTLGTTADASAQVEAAIAARHDRYSGALRWVPLDALAGSPNQLRVDDEAQEFVSLVRSIEKNGLLYPPNVRAELSGRFTILAGHRRIAALRTIVARGGGIPSPLRNMLMLEGGVARVVAFVRDEEGLDAHLITIAENLHRKDLSAWERVLTYRRYQEALEESGRPARVEDVANAFRVPYQTAAPYLSISRALSPSIVREAGADDREGYRLLSLLSQARLRCLARIEPAAKRTQAIREALQEKRDRPVVDGIDDMHDEAAKVPRETPTLPAPRAGGGQLAPTRREGYQVNIRGSIDQVRPAQAARWAVPMADVLRQLLARGAGALEAETAARVGADLRLALQQLQNSSGNAT